MSDLQEFIFDMEITHAVNPISYEEVQLDPPVKILSWEEYDKFQGKWERFCRNAAAHGENPRIARFELLGSDAAGTLSPIRSGLGHGASLRRGISKDRLTASEPASPSGARQRNLTGIGNHPHGRNILSPTERQGVMGCP